MYSPLTRATASAGTLALGLESQAHTAIVARPRAHAAIITFLRRRASVLAAIRAGDRVLGEAAGAPVPRARPPLTISTSKPGSGAPRCSVLPIPICRSLD